jgi:ABC-2 type transport system ATP-binding protein
LFGAFYRRRADPEMLLDRFALAEKADQPFRTLSGGQKQRLALALACVNRPALLVFDEPTAGLDPQSRRDLHGEIRRLKREGCTVLISTHYLEEAEQLCDHIAIIDRGRIVATGAPRDLIARSSALQSVTLVADRPFDAARLAQVAGGAGLRCEGKVAHFRTENATRLLPALSEWLDGQGIELLELHVRKASLEDVFLTLTHSAEGPNPASP